MPHPRDTGFSVKLGVHVATWFSMMGHARPSQLAPYNIEVGTSIAGSNNGTIGIERRSDAPAVIHGLKSYQTKANRLLRAEMLRSLVRSGKHRQWFAARIATKNSERGAGRRLSGWVHFRRLGLLSNPRFACLSRLLRSLGCHPESLMSFKLQHNVALKRLAARSESSSTSPATISLLLATSCSPERNLYISPFSSPEQGTVTQTNASISTR